MLESKGRVKGHQVLLAFCVWRGVKVGWCFLNESQEDQDKYKTKLSRTHKESLKSRKRDNLSCDPGYALPIREILRLYNGSERTAW